MDGRFSEEREWGECSQEQGLNKSLMMEVLCVCCVFSSWAYLLVIEEQIKQASIALLLRFFWVVAW